MAPKDSPQVAAKAKTCFFCGREGPLTREHVLPDWLRSIGFKGTGVRELIQDSDMPIIMQGGPFTKTLKIVCGDCNNVWMSAIEDAAKPVLLAGFKASVTGEQVRLDKGAQLTLARWAFKTAAVMTRLSAPSARTFPMTHARSFHANNRIPDNIQIWLGAAAVTPTMQGDQVAQFRYNPTRTDVKAGDSTSTGRGYQVFIRLFNVVFYILGFDSMWQLTGELSENLKSGLLAIWPPVHPKLWWPPAASLDDFGGVDALSKALANQLPTLVSGTTRRRP